MLNLNTANSNNINFDGIHNSLRKNLSKESRQLLDSAVKEANEVEKSLKNVKCGKAHLENNGRGIFDTLKFQIKTSNGDLIELLKGKPSSSDPRRFGIRYTEVSELSKPYSEHKTDFVDFDTSRRSKTFRLEDKKPNEHYWDPGYYDELEHNPDLLQKVETLIKKYVPLFISKKYTKV